MSIERLWAGWRMPYVSEATGAGAQPAGVGAEGEEHGCTFCKILGSGEPESATYVVWRGRGCAAVLNAYPYASGHVLVMPTRHVAELGELGGDESAGVWSGIRDAVAALREAYSPEGFNVGFNLGRAAGAGIPAHLHAHVVPRWVGDTNFMTCVAEARVLPESLASTWERVRAAWPLS
ncbi:MAG: HIT family protein [Acidimicrobiales bacterium]